MHLHESTPRKRGSCRTLLLSDTCIGLALLLLTAIPLTGAQLGRIPSRFTDDVNGLLWIDSDEISRAGSWLLTGLNEDDRRQMRWLTDELGRERASTDEAGADADPCEYSYTLGPAGGTMMSFDIDSLARRQSAILVGTVIASKDGLLDGAPYTLLLVAVDRWLIRGEDTPASTEIFVSYRSPVLEIGDLTVCRPNDGLPPAPAVGAPVLFLNVYAPPPYFIEGVSGYHANHGLIYDGEIEGIKTLMASDRILEDSPAWLLNATVASLELRVARILGLETKQ